MTEGHVITSLPLDGPWPQGSVGPPLDGVELRLASDDGTLAAPAEVGSVHLRGPEPFPRILAQARSHPGGLYRRLVRHRRPGHAVTTHGFLTFVGRKHDLIITSGFNVYPPVVERVINACPGVQESAVLGLPDRQRGERVVAVIVPGSEALNEAALKGYLSDHLVDYQRPAQIRVAPCSAPQRDGQGLATPVA